MKRARVIGVGSYLPQKILTNDDLSRMVDTSDAWIVERTGITQRHIAADGELTSDLGTAAARAALERAELDPAALDLIIVATSTPDNTFPATAAAIQRKLGARVGSPAFDVQAVCAGFVYALSVADSLMRTGQARHALVIGAETFSRILDWQDRSTCVLFGDGAGAVVLRAEEGGAAGGRGLLGHRLGADGRHYGDLYVDGGPSSTGTSGHLRMNGREVFRRAVAALADSVVTVCGEAGFEIDALDWLVPHQANRRIIDAVGKRLGIDPARVVVTVDRHANTSAASIPLALDDAYGRDQLRSGQLIALNGMGGGFTWGANLLRW
ncbi:MAG: beta-ketoacyl-ACP synthase III [Geminicoccaceae bacterium]